MAPRRPPLGGNPNTAIQQQEKRRGGGPPPPDDDRDPEDAPSASSRGYRTGNDYPAQDDESLLRPSGEHSPDLGDRDIYGEDDPLPDDPDQPVQSDQVDAESDNPDATRAGPPRKLVVLAGPDKGKVKRFNGVRLVVGRTSSCNVHLSDNSVSRRHLELVQGGNSVLLRDLGSGNGTKVNGERVNERVLKHEDVIEIGQTKLQYVDEAEAIRLMREEAERREEEEKRKKEEEEARKKAEEEAAAQAAAEAAANPPPAEEPKPEGESDDEEDDEAAGKARGKGGLDWRQKVGLGVAGGAVLFVMFILLPQLFAPKGPPPPEPKQVLAAKKLEQARTAIVEERYEDALGLAETADRMWPGIDADGFAAEARNELAAIKALGEARSFLDQKRFEDCRLALAQVPETSPRRVEEKQKLQAELDEKQNGYLIGNINEALDALDVDSARQLLAQLPEGRRVEFQARILAAERELAKQEKLDKQRSKEAAVESERRRKAARRAQIAAAFKAVERKLNGGEFDRAGLECDRVLDDARDPEVRSRALEIKRLIPVFARAYEDGERKFASRALESAVRPLKKARDTYRDIGLQGSLGAQLDDHLMEALAQAGKSALLRNDLSSAVVHYREALSISPGDENAQAGLARVAQRADDLYLEAYMLRDRDPKQSNAKLKLVLEVAPKGSSAYEKAKAQLARNQP